MDGNIIGFLKAINSLKKTKRAGWVNRGIQSPESICDHMYMMSIISLLVIRPNSDPRLDQVKCIKMALIHDMAEAIVGDITPSDRIEKEKKHLLEKEAMTSLLDTLGDYEVSREIMDLWTEYEDSLSRESIFVHQIDKLEMIIQAHIYEEEHRINLDDFYDCIDEKIRDPVLLDLAKRLLTYRK